MIVNASPQDSESDRLLPESIVDRSQQMPGSGRGRMRWVTVIGVFALLAGLVWVVFQSTALLPSLDQGTQETVSPSDESAIVVALGRLEPVGEVVEVASPSGSGDARIQELRVQEGSIVEPGQVLAVLDNEARLLAERDVALQRLDEAKSQLEKATIQSRSDEAQVRADLEAAKANQNKTASTFQRQEELRASSAISSEEYEQSRLDLETAQQKVAQLEAALKRFQTDSKGQLVDISVAQHAVEVARSQLALAESMLAQAYITSPGNGQILKLELQPGERTAQPTLLKLGDTRQMYARLEVYESDVPRVLLGAQVELGASALSQKLVGKVSRISPLVQKQSIVSAIPAANTDARVVEVMVALDADSTRLAAQFIGMQVVASVAAAPRASAKQSPGSLP